MSVPDSPSSVPPHTPLSTPPQRPPGLGGCLAAFLIIIGIVLLLPGICSLIFMAVMLPGGGGSSDMAGIWVVGLLISAAGVGLIWFASKNR